MSRWFQNAIPRRPGVRPSRRQALHKFADFVGASALVGASAAAQVPQRRARPPVIAPPEYSQEIMEPINLHEFEDAARKRISQLAYDYIAAGAADELTLQANLQAFDRFWIRRRIMTDVSRIDTSVELFGQRIEHPILLGPAGAKGLLHPDGDRVTALAAHHSGATYVGGSPQTMPELARDGQAPNWWAATLGQPTRREAEEYARRVQDAGSSAICVSVDYPYTASRDRNIRNQFDLGMVGSRNFSTSEPPTDGFQAGMLQPYTPSMTWRYLDWLHSATDLPIVVKGIVTAEDAALAVANGAQAVVVSNHGGRTLDGMLGTLDALPEVVEAVARRVPVLVDGGVRRGGDVVKALAIGATAILIGRPYLWGLGAFGQEGVQRVIELLHGELRVAMGLSGVASIDAIDSGLIRRAWKP